MPSGWVGRRKDGPKSPCNSYWISMENVTKTQVAIGIVFDGRCVLIARRPERVVLGGYWEFPGGKLEAGETPEAAVVREVLEELGVTVEPVRRLPVIIHAYPHAVVELMPIVCRHIGGEPAAIGCVEFRWILPSELTCYEFPPANAELLAAIVAMPVPFL